jgi:hypothetical protein
MHKQRSRWMNAPKAQPSDPFSNSAADRPMHQLHSQPISQQYSEPIDSPTAKRPMNQQQPADQCDNIAAN